MRVTLPGLNSSFRLILRCIQSNAFVTTKQLSVWKTFRLSVFTHTHTQTTHIHKKTDRQYKELKDVIVFKIFTWRSFVYFLHAYHQRNCAWTHFEWRNIPKGNPLVFTSKHFNVSARCLKGRNFHFAFR